MSPTEEHEALVQRARTARAGARDLVEHSRELCSQSIRGLGRMLIRVTADSDRRRTVDVARLHRLRRLSAHVGRDRAIEDAKLHLRGRYDITGTEAFDLLRHLSQTHNRKLADIAKQVLAG